VLRALPVADRNDAIAAFEAERNSATATSAGFEAALAGVYDYYIDAAADAKLGAHVIDEKVLVRLATAFTDNILFENGNSANFDVKTLGTDFETNLKTVISAHFTEINGTAVTADNGADLAVEAILAVMNSIPSAQVANVKTVLGDASISLYEAPAATPTRRPSSSNNDGYFRLPDSDTDIKPVPTPPAAEDKHIFPDTVNHWAKDYAAALAKRGIFKGYEDGNYKPDLNITREEIAVALTRALGLEAKAEAAAGTDFLDSADISEWARSAVNLMVADGVFTGYDDGNYRPHQTITREELIAVIIRVLDAEEVSDGTLDYTDAHKVAEWARDYVAKATELLIVSGYPDGSFRGANAVTRAEAAKILYQFLETVE